ncbi:hypothetical protein J6590_074721, partial [Homalodisca vitripennis]
TVHLISITAFSESITPLTREENMQPELLDQPEVGETSIHPPTLVKTWEPARPNTDE